jgi:hypothetical protein
VTQADSRPAEVRAGGFRPVSLEVVTAFVLLALASVELVGYGFGDANGGLTVPVLKRHMDRSLYPGDLFVAIAGRTPTAFYRSLAALHLGRGAIPPVFFMLYVVATAALLAGVYRIGRWFGGPVVGAVTVLAAFPVRTGLAGAALHRLALSPALVAQALGIWAVALLLEGRRALPLLLLLIAAGTDLLYSAYALVGFLFVVIAEGRRATARRTFILSAAALLPFFFIAWMTRHALPLTREGVDLLRIRIPESLASAFGADVPALGSLLALGTIALARLSRDKRALVALLFAATAWQFLLGMFFTELVPVTAAFQYQPHRSWFFLMILLYGLTASVIVDGWREGGLARVAAVVTGVLLIPGLEPLLPVALFLQATVGRPVPATWTRLLAAGVLATVGAWSRPGLEWRSPADLAPALAGPTLPLIAAVGLLLVLGRSSQTRSRPLLAGAAAALTIGWLGPAVYGRIRPHWEAGSWRDMQNWLRLNTPASAVVVTPPQESGFRVFSERAVVGEWADRTQGSLDDAFVMGWAGRMDLLEGERYARLPDEQVLAIARQFGATHIVMPARRSRRSFVEAYRNTGYVVYELVPSDGPGGEPARLRRAGAR